MLAADESVRSQIRRFMEDQFLVEFAEVGEHANLLELGYLDSFGYVRLFGFLKEQLQVSVATHELLDRVPVSLAEIVALAQRMRPGVS